MIEFIVMFIFEWWLEENLRDYQLNWLRSNSDYELLEYMKQKLLFNIPLLTLFLFIFGQKISLNVKLLVIESSLGEWLKVRCLQWSKM